MAVLYILPVASFDYWGDSFYMLNSNIANALTDSPHNGTFIESGMCSTRTAKMHNMKLHPAPFAMIRSGEKTIELRLYDEKRQQIQVGDQIVFTNNKTGEVLEKTVGKLHRFDSFEELYKTLPLLQCGYTAEDIDTARPSDMEQYYSAEEQRKYGVVGIELY